jgi:hypothetical protein
MFSEFAALSKPEIPFEGADGKDYILSPLGFKEIAEFCIWLQFKEYTQAKQFGLDKDKLQEIYDKCKNDPISFEDQRVTDAIILPDGISKILYYSLRIKHPEIKETELSRIINIDMNAEIEQALALSFGLVKKKDEGEEDTLGE